MKYLAVMSALLLGACVHGQEQPAPVYNMHAQPLAHSRVTATCGESFNATVDHLAAAMNLEGNYAFSQPAPEAPTAYEGRISRF